MIGRVTILLRKDVVPKTAETFKALCIGGMGYGYKGSSIDSAFPGHVKAGEIKDCQRPFNEENFTLNHTSGGAVGLLKEGTGFYIVTSPTPMLDGKHVVFGQVVEGMDVVRKIQSLGSIDGNVSEKVIVVKCGVKEN